MMSSAGLMSSPSVMVSKKLKAPVLMPSAQVASSARVMTIFSMLQRAVYNRMNKDMIDYDKRMDIILGQLKDEFREQAI